MNFRKQPKISIQRLPCSLDFSEIRRNSVIFLLLLFGCLGNASGCRGPARHDPSILHTMIDSAPSTLNPRLSLDAVGQRLEMLVFRGLTTLDSELNPQADLSEKWRLESGGKTVRFTIPKDIRDHAGRSIDARLIQRCFQNYFFKASPSPLKAAFSTLTSVTQIENEVIFHLSAPDPYLVKNLSAVRYFASDLNAEDPCRDPGPDEHLITNGLYSVSPYPERFEKELILSPRKQSAPRLSFQLIRDETSRLLKMMNGEIDFVQNSFSPIKTAWLTRQGFQMVQRNGANTSYLAFNLRDPRLAKLPVRLAIAHAIDRTQIVRYKLNGEATLASSFLISSLPEGAPFTPFNFDPAESERLLDQAGYPRQSDGVRFHLRYKTTTVKEGLELAQIFRENLKAVGISLDLEPVEPAVFFASIRKGNFQIYMSRWVGASDGSLFYRTLHSGEKDNRVGYRNPDVDAWTASSLRENNLLKRRKILLSIQTKVFEEMPYFPLWHWTNALLVRKDLVLPPSESLSLSGSYIPFADLR
ncbi:MAG: ABC transporter substrate-binding protein [Cryobacterium sp.]|nr:ABC transporter substrate-binding protein [Oligoflexia bacterium]